MKKLIVSLFLLIALTVDVPAANQGVVNYDEYKPHLSGLSGNPHAYSSRCGLNESERADNALARVFGRTPPHVDPCVLVQVQMINPRHDKW